MEKILGARFIYLLISLLLLFFFYPFFEKVSFGVRVLDIVFLFILLSGIYAISEKRNVFIIALLLAITGYGSTILNYFLMIRPLQYLSFVTYGIFFTILTALIISYIIRQEKVTTNTIYGSICGYLLIGVIWTLLFSMVELFEPGSFFLIGEPLVDHREATVNRQVFTNLIYYSYVTLTTLGYGDVIPVSPPAKALSSLEAVTGQLYIAVLIARLVALQIVHSSQKERE